MVGDGSRELPASSAGLLRMLGWAVYLLAEAVGYEAQRSIIVMVCIMTGILFVAIKSTDRFCDMVAGVGYRKLA